MRKSKLSVKNWHILRNTFTLLAFVFLLNGIQAQNYTWTHMPSLPNTLYSPVSFTIGSDIYVVTGIGVNPGLTGTPYTMAYQVWDFNTVSNTWTQKNNFPGQGVYGASAFVIGSYGYIVNGWDSVNASTGPSALWQYNPSTDTWASEAAFPGTTRYLSAEFSLNGLGYIVCGFSGEVPGNYVNDVWSYDPTANSWTQKSNFPGGARENMVCFTIGNTGYAGMGATSDGMGSYFVESDWYKYDGSTDTWTELNTFPGDALYGAYTFVINGQGYVVNGMDQNGVYYNTTIGPSNKVWEYTPSSDSWSLVGLFPDTAIYQGASSSSSIAGYMGFGAVDFTSSENTSRYYRYGPGTAPYSCTVSVSQYEISNAVYNFQANGNFSPTAQITWNFGDGSTGIGTSVIHNYTTVGNYTATAYVLDSACSDSSNTTVNVSNINNCSVILNSNNYGTLFNLSASVIQGAGPYTYQWSCSTDSSFSSTSPDPVVTVPVNTPTSYCVTVTDTTGCVASACRTVVDSQTYYTPCQAFIIVVPDSAIPGYYNCVIYVGGPGPFSYLWNFGDGDTSTQEFPNHTYAVPGYYVVCLTVSNGNGCSFTFCDSAFYAFKYGGGPMAQFNVTNEVVVSALGVNNITKANTVSVYPNPANSEITINAAGQKIDNATIYDINGQTVLNAKSPSQNQVDVSQLTDGIYFIEVKVNGTSTRLKFVKAN